MIERHWLSLFRALLMAQVMVLLVATHAPSAEATNHGLRLPDGFDVVEFADSTLANDIHCLTIGPKGQIVVSGRGYIRQLLSEKGDKATRALDFANAPKDGAMGLFWEEDALYCVGDGGLRVYRNASGKGRLKPSTLLFQCRTGSEHLAHAVQRGPDGWLYLLAGDQTRIGKSQITSTRSPIQNPNGGVVMRFAPDFKQSEVVAHGFRNAYGMDFNEDGELFTFDSDNERCVSLPWYEYTRCYHVVSGGHHGWLSPQFAATWRKPPHFVDVVAPVATLGRGSPTGVACYRHGQFPKRYRGGLFLLDWTFGQVHFVSLSRKGSSYAGKAEVFLRSTGDNGFAPTAAAVHPLTGDLYVAIGGRGTRGAVYRIRHTKGFQALEQKALTPYPRRSLEWKAGMEKTLAGEAVGKDEHARRRALELIARHHERFSTKLLKPLVQANVGHDDRYLRQAVANLLRRLPEKTWKELLTDLTAPRQRLTACLVTPSLDIADLVSDSRQSTAVRLEAARLVQLALGDLGDNTVKGTVWEGYTRRAIKPVVPSKTVKLLRDAFPANHDTLDLELSRTLALVEDASPATLAAVLKKITLKSHPTRDVHYLIVSARLHATRSAAQTKHIAETLLSLDAKISEYKLNRDSNWPRRLMELHAGLVKRDKNLNATLLAHASFGRPDHAVFAHAPGFDRAGAAAKFIARSAKEDFVWSAELVRLIGELPAAKSLPVLRKLWGEHGLDETILPLLAKHAQAADHARFLTGLVSPRLDVLRSTLGAIEKLSVPADKTSRREEALALIRGLRQLPAGKEEDKIRPRLVARLRKITGAKKTTAEEWAGWFTKTYPAQAKSLADGVDLAAWQKRLAKIDWDKGDSKKGLKVYTKASCASCHSGAAALGPDLRGVTGRFSRADLFTAIVVPSKDVSPRYRTTQLTTVKGQLYQGIIVYEAVDSVIIQTGPAVTMRLDFKQVASRRLTATSLMPQGLIDRLKDEEIADLYAYLKSLTMKK